MSCFITASVDGQESGLKAVNVNLETKCKSIFGTRFFAHFFHFGEKHQVRDFVQSPISDMIAQQIC